MNRICSSLIRLLLAIPLIMGFIVGAAHVQASTIGISCQGLDTPDTQCTFSGNTSAGFIDTVKNVLDSIQSQQQTNGVCVRDNVDSLIGSFTCTLPSAGQELPALTLQCSETQGGASCTMPQLSTDLFSLSCTKSNGEGQCALSSDEKAVRSRLVAAGLMGNAADVGTNLFAGCALRAGYINGQPTDFQRDCDALMSLLRAGDAASDAQARALIEEITPHNVDVAVDTSAEVMQQQLSGIAARLARVRHHSRGLDVTGLQFFDGQQWINANALMASNDPANVDAPPVVSFADSRLGVFLDGALISGNQKQDSNNVEGKTDYKGQEFTLGIDYRISDALVAGVAYSLSLTNTDFSGDRGKLDTTGYTLLAYASYYKDAWYLEGTAATGGNRYEQDRRMRCDVATCGIDFNVLASSEYYGDQNAFSLGGGYALSFGALTLTPNAQWSMMKVATDAYHESTDDVGSGTGFLLAMDDQSRSHNTVSVGVDASYAVSTSLGVVLPHASIDLRHELDDDLLVVNGQFLGDSANDQSFSLATRAIDTTYYVVGIGSSLQLAGGNSAFLDLKSLLGYDDASQWQLRAGWRWEF